MWYVVIDRDASYTGPDDRVWTVSKDPNKPGWETDCGYQGYGLTKADAEFLVSAANILDDPDGNTRFIAVPEAMWTPEELVELALEFKRIVNQKRPKLYVNSR